MDWLIGIGGGILGDVLLDGLFDTLRDFDPNDFRRITRPRVPTRPPILNRMNPTDEDIDRAMEGSHWRVIPQLWEELTSRLRTLLGHYVDENGRITDLVERSAWDIFMDQQSVRDTAGALAAEIERGMRNPGMPIDFSHPSLGAFRHWLSEISRTDRSTGIVADLTNHDDWTIDHSEMSLEAIYRTDLTDIHPILDDFMGVRAAQLADSLPAPGSSRSSRPSSSATDRATDEARAEPGNEGPTIPDPGEPLEIDTLDDSSAARKRPPPQDTIDRARKRREYFRNINANRGRNATADATENLRGNRRPLGRDDTRVEPGGVQEIDVYDVGEFFYSPEQIFGDAFIRFIPIGRSNRRGNSEVIVC